MALICVASPPKAFAEPKISDGVVKIGVITDMSGPYSDNNGAGSVLAAQMAVEDFGGKVLGMPIEVIYADHQNKPDIAMSIAREWIDQGKVDAFADLAASSVGLALGHLAQDKNRIILNSGSSTTRITNEECNTVTAHWTYDSYALSKGTAAAITKRGGKTWFFITADYVFGHSLQENATKFIMASGGKVIGSVLAPFPTSDFSSFLITAQSSGADVVALANSGADFVNSVKQAGEFGLTKKQLVTGLLVYINDIHAIGLKAAAGDAHHDGLLLEPRQGNARLVGALLREVEAHADDESCWCLFVRSPLSEGRGGGGNGRGPGGYGANASDASERHVR